MGHLRLGRLPQTRNWQAVVGLLEDEVGSGEVAAAALQAAQQAFRRASVDPTLIHSFYLLTQIPLAARAPDFVKALQERGLPVSTPPSLFAVLGAFAEAVDGFARHRVETSVFGEMAQFAAAESLVKLGRPATESMFETSPADVQSALRRLSAARQFGFLARDFFSRFTRRFLTYYLSRVLSNHVGSNRRFENIDEHTAFMRALDLHCWEAARIVQDFAGDWFAKTEFEGGIDPEKARGFLHVAFNKIQTEMKARGVVNGA